MPPRKIRTRAPRPNALNLKKAKAAAPFMRTVTTEQKNAALLAMNRAIEKLSVKPSLALIDGNRNSGISMPSRCIVKGDAKCADIAAASILAKVTRDRYMIKMAEKYPQYHFEKHKGYGTKVHYAALREYGPCEIHRPSFLRKMH